MTENVIQIQPYTFQRVSTFIIEGHNCYFNRYLLWKKKGAMDVSFAIYIMIRIPTEYFNM